MSGEVKVTAVVHPFKLLPSKREAILHVNGALRVVGELVWCMFAGAQPLG